MQKGRSAVTIQSTDDATTKKRARGIRDRLTLGAGILFGEAGTVLSTVWRLKRLRNAAVPMWARQALEQGRKVAQRAQKEISDVFTSKGVASAVKAAAATSVDVATTRVQRVVKMAAGVLILSSFAYGVGQATPGTVAAYLQSQERVGGADAPAKTSAGSDTGEALSKALAGAKDLATEAASTVTEWGEYGWRWMTAPVQSPPDAAKATEGNDPFEGTDSGWRGR